MSDRPFFNASIPELEELFEKHVHDRAVLGQLWTELTYRKTDRAKQLRKEIKGILGGDVPAPPKPPRPSDPDDQMDLLE